MQAGFFKAPNIFNAMLRRALISLALARASLPRHLWANEQSLD
jgi:hypothetical protein